MKNVLRLLAMSSFLLLAGCKEESLYGGLSLRDANEMNAVLATAGIDATRTAGTDNTFTLSVPKDQLAEAVQLLSSKGYPKESYRTLADVFPGNGLVVSPFEHRARFMFALSQELERTISSIDGVVSARVHVAVPEYELRGSAGQKPSASVLVHHQPSIDPSDLAPKIRLIVANGVQGLAYSDVSIAFFPVGGQNTEGSSAEGALGFPSSMTGAVTHWIPGAGSLVWAGALVCAMAGLWLLLGGRRRSNA